MPPNLVGGVLLFFFQLIGALSSTGQIAPTSDVRFVGNIIRSTTTPDPVFDTSWNRATPENCGKWVNVEEARDVIDWTQLDFAYNHTRPCGMLFKLHTIACGQQFPARVDTLPAKGNCEELEKWFAARHPGFERIELMNQPLNGHTPVLHKSAIGGSCTTEWDWTI